jgi:RNA polymerase sigma-70 factor (ECF subfamily)
MYNVAVRIMNHNGEAEDVLQDAFLDAFQKINDFRQTSVFGAWLKQIIINRALNQLRNRKVQWVDIEEGYEVCDEESYDEDSINYDVQ